MIESADQGFLQTGRILLRTYCWINSFGHHIRRVLWIVMCLLFGGCESFLFFFCPFPLPFLLHPIFPAFPYGEGLSRQKKPNRGEKWNIDFFFFFIQLLIAFLGFPFFTLHPLFSSTHRVLSCPLSPQTIVSILVVLFLDGGLRRSWLLIKRNKLCEIEKLTVCVFSFRAMLRLTCTWWPRTQKILPTPLMYWR